MNYLNIKSPMPATDHTGQTDRRRPRIEREYMGVKREVRKQAMRQGQMQNPEERTVRLSSIEMVQQSLLEMRMSMHGGNEELPPIVNPRHYLLVDYLQNLRDYQQSIQKQVRESLLKRAPVYQVGKDIWKNVVDLRKNVNSNGGNVSNGVYYSNQSSKHKNTINIKTIDGNTFNGYSSGVPSHNKIKPVLVCNKTPLYQNSDRHNSIIHDVTLQCTELQKRRDALNLSKLKRSNLKLNTISPLNNNYSNRRNKLIIQECNGNNNNSINVNNHNNGNDTSFNSQQHLLNDESRHRLKVMEKMARFRMIDKEHPIAISTCRYQEPKIMQRRYGKKLVSKREEDGKNEQCSPWQDQNKTLYFKGFSDQF